MRILLIGATGHIGSVAKAALEERHEVIAVSRNADISVDLTDAASVGRMYERAGAVDAVVVCVGSVPFKALEDLTLEDYSAGFGNKVLGQIEVVRQGLKLVNDSASFTLTTGILAREPIRTGVAASAANGALEAFVAAAAPELERGLRINAVSPSVLENSPGYHPFFPGFERVTDDQVARAFVRSVEGHETGRIYSVG